MNIIQTKIYGKKYLNNQSILANLYLQGITRIKLNRGKYYDLHHSANIGYYVTISPVQYDITTDKHYTVTEL